jgi:anti-sigma factor RsiW
MNHNDEDAELEFLLPFYINGTLDADECAKVDAALARSPQLRSELEQLSQIARAVKTGGREMTQGAGKDSPEGEARLQAMLGKLEDKAPAPSTAAALPPKGLGTILGFLNPKRWHPAVSLALVAVAVGQGVAISNLNSDKAASTAQLASLQKRVGDLEFELASGPGVEKRGSVMIQLKADARWAEVEALLGKEGLTIVAGPSDDTLILSSGAKDAALDAQIARLRSSPLIASADKAA